MSVGSQLKALLASMDEHLAGLRAGVLRAEAEYHVKRALCEALPLGLPLAPAALRVCGQVYKADAEMVFSVASREDALALMDTLPSVPVVMVKAGCTTFVPEERFVEDNRGTKVSPVGDVIYRLSTWCNALQEEYGWWTRLAGLSTAA